MKLTLLFTFLFTLSLFTVVNAQSFYGTTDLKTFRDGRDAEFRDKELTPLKPEDFDSFRGLNYFPVNKTFRVNAAFTRTADEKYFEMPTSSGKTKKFVKYGVVTFKLAGKTRQLNVYQIDPVIRAKFPEYADLLFIPFKDTTYRTETYGGGRYIDIKTPTSGKVLIDFNLAYNPKCAYGGDKYSCPIPPRENNLDIDITAGEKTYPYTGHDKY